MPHKPQFKYFLSDTTNPVQKESKIWSAPLPTTRKQPQKVTGISITYGDYFSAVHSFLEQNRFEILTSAFSKSINRQIIPEEIRVCLVKHGEFYHPSLIEVVMNKESYKFVLNVAISATGRDCIEREYSCLKRLGNDFSFSSIPEVYGYGKACVKESRHTLSMFLGKWFEGFNEFHISHDKTDNKHKILVWDSEKGNFFLSPDNTLELYRQAAMILTCYYNIETFEQIFPWHHAAGDFVIRLRNNKAELKLITARQYAPMFAKKEEDEDTDRDVEMIPEALLVFLLNLSIRMRLDRLNGVGDIVWSDDIAVQGTLKGFFQGLRRKDSTGLFSDSCDTYFHDYLLSSCTEKDFYDLSLAIVNSYNPLAPEIPVIRQNIKKHAEVLFDAVTGQL
ncbi:MAG: hypothetical protein H8E80_09420 [Desulfobacteraceae bacterium]|uniref:Uncharacterized protein n=1 Tax=Candidatus Desulfaltia bathyphila TaxID=2841697 RepID=A0A8J6N7P6_9BACT|nr:hypothetical protein [Candidatus Desulfaltia bathyphila]